MASSGISTHSSKSNIEWQLLIELTGDGKADHEGILIDPFLNLTQKIEMPSDKCIQVLDAVRETLMYAQSPELEETGNKQICFRVWISPSNLDVGLETDVSANAGSQSGQNSWGFFIASRKTKELFSTVNFLIDLFLYREGDKP